MGDSKAKGIVAIIGIIIAIAGGVEEGVRRAIRDRKQKKRQRKVDNTPVKVTTSFVVPEASADLVHVSKDELSEKYKLSESDLREFKSYLSTAGGQAFQVAMAVKSTTDLVKCNIPISELYKINDNPNQLRAFVLKDGKFDQQAILSPAGLKAVAPLLVFQCMAAVTSQYYQQVITERLDEVNSKLDQLMQYVESQDLAKIQSCAHIIAELYNKSSYGVEDKIRVYTCYDDLRTLLLHYRNLINDISLSKLHIEYERSDYDEACAKVQALKKSHFFAYLTYALYAETLLSRSNAIRWKIAEADNNKEEMKIVEKSSDFNIMKHYATSFDSIKHNVLGYIDECMHDAVVKKEEIQRLRVDTEKLFLRAEQQILQKENELNPTITAYLNILPDGESEVYVDL